MANAELRHLPRLFLLTPALGEAASFAPLLEASLDAGDVASVLLLLATRDEGEAKKIVKSLAPLIQQRGVALLLPDDPQLAARASADGVHMRGSGATLEQALDDAIQSVKPERIVGVGPLSTKHDAMTTAERDVDYLLFGGPFPEARGMTPAAIAERVAWWSEIFTVPCVGYAHRLDEVVALANAGADFVALGDAVWNDPRGPAAAIRDAQAALSFSTANGS